MSAYDSMIMRDQPAFKGKKDKKTNWDLYRQFFTKQGPPSSVAELGPPISMERPVLAPSAPVVAPTVAQLKPKPLPVVNINTPIVDPTPTAPEPTDLLDPFTVTPEEKAQYSMRDAYSTGAERNGTAFGLMQALQAMRQQEAAPTPATVSGGSVIGLTPEQTNALLDRVQRKNEIEQQMHQHRMDAQRAEAEAQAGRVFSAQEAEKTRRHADMLEQRKLDEQLRREELKIKRPDYKPVGESAPGYFYDANSSGVPTIVRAGGADILPISNAHGTWADVKGPNGTTVKQFVRPGETPELAPAPSAPPSLDQLNDNIRQWTNEFLGMEIKNHETGKYEPVDLDLAANIARQFVEGGGKGINLSANGIDMRKQQNSNSRLRVQQRDDGSKVLVPEEDGLQVAPAKPRDIAAYMKDNFGATWRKGKNGGELDDETKQVYANALAAAKFTLPEAEQMLGKSEEDGFFGKKIHYIWHGDTGAQTSAGAPKELVYDPATRTLK